MILKGQEMQTFSEGQFSPKSAEAFLSLQINTGLLSGLNVAVEQSRDLSMAVGHGVPKVRAGGH